MAAGSERHFNLKLPTVKEAPRKNQIQIENIHGAFQSLVKGSSEEIEHHPRGGIDVEYQLRRSFSEQGKQGRSPSVLRAISFRPTDRPTDRESDI